MYFTEKAYYVDYINANSSQAIPFGYAEDNEGRVFNFTIEDNQLNVGKYYRNKNGDITNGLWDNAVLSFADFNIQAFPSTPAEDNVYEITDDANKLLFAALAGYADVFVMEYVTVSVEVTGESSFISRVHFNGDTAQYQGDCIGTLHAINETTIPLIDDYLKDGGTAKEDLSEQLLSVLQTLKADNNYQLDVVSSTNNHYIDTVTKDYYYSENVNNPTASKGYLNLLNAGYNFTISNNEVVLGNEISYTSSTSTSIWDNVSSIHNFKNINLSDIQLEEVEGGLKLSNNTSVLTSLYDLVHSTAFFPSINTETDYAIFTKYDETSLEFTLHIEAEADFTVKITGINQTKDERIEKFITENKDFDKNDISALIIAFEALKSAGTYKIVLDNKFSSWSSALYNVGSLEIDVSEDNYFVTNTTDDTKSYGYKMNEGKLTRYTMKDGEFVFGDSYDGDMQNNSVFTTLSSFNKDEFKAEYSLQKVYRVSDDTTLGYIADLLTLPQESFITTISEVSITLDADSNISVSGTSTFYGSFTASINKA